MQLQQHAHPYHLGQLVWEDRCTSLTQFVCVDVHRELVCLHQQPLVNQHTALLSCLQATRCDTNEAGSFISLCSSTGPKFAIL